MLVGSELGQPDERKTKIEKRREHQESQAGMCNTRLRRRFIHACAGADAKFESTWGIIIDPAVEHAGRGETRERTATVTPKGGDQRMPGGETQRANLKAKKSARITWGASQRRS